MVDLYPTFDVPDIEEEDNEVETGYKQSSYFDFNKGDFVTDETGRIVVATGVDAWKNWCIKTVLTQRYSCLSYSDNYGVEINEAFEEQEQSGLENMIEHTVTEALLADPYQRVVDVIDFEFEWLTDGIIVMFTVLGIENTDERITVNLQGGE